MNEDSIDGEEVFTKRIEMYFGSPCSTELLEALEQRAIYKDLSTQNLLLQEFRDACNLMKNEKIIKFEGVDYSMNYFDSHCVVHADLDGVFFSPKVSMGAYMHDGLQHPKLVLEDGFLRNKIGAREFAITDSILKKLGKGYEEFFKLQFIRFERV